MHPHVNQVKDPVINFTKRSALIKAPLREGPAAERKKNAAGSQRETVEDPEGEKNKRYLIIFLYLC